MRISPLTLALGSLVAVGLPSSALGAPAVDLSASLRPEHLGAGTTIQLGFTVATDTAVPPPLTDVRLKLPADLGLTTSGLGIAGCKIRALEAEGLDGCPPNSVMGHGSALLELRLGPRIIEESAHTVTLVAPITGQKLTMLFYVSGETPVLATIVFPTEIAPAAPPFSDILDTKLPLVPTLPGAPDSSVVKLTTTIGPAGIIYYQYSHKHRLPYRPKGILLPKTCPAGGFRFGATFEFANSTSVDSTATVRCPRLHAHKYLPLHSATRLRGESSR